MITKEKQKDKISSNYLLTTTIYNAIISLSKENKFNERRVFKLYLLQKAY